MTQRNMESSGNSFRNIGDILKISLEGKPKNPIVVNALNDLRKICAVPALNTEMITKMPVPNIKQQLSEISNIISTNYFFYRQGNSFIRYNNTQDIPLSDISTADINKNLICIPHNLQEKFDQTLAIFHGLVAVDSQNILQKDIIRTTDGVLLSISPRDGYSGTSFRIPQTVNISTLSVDNSSGSDIRISYFDQGRVSTTIFSKIGAGTGITARALRK